MKKIKNNPLLILIALMFVLWLCTITFALNTVSSDKTVRRLKYENKILKEDNERLVRFNRDLGEQLNEMIQKDRGD